ncbi:DNase I-like protein [Meredithblackwellia eburnea MCA 4105]
MVRLTTWNVNGIKTLPQYYPWNTLKTYEAILDHLGADITCIQETKITRTQLDSSLALIPTYDSFFSFYRRVPLKGIHGTAIFTRRATTVPVKAEEGIGSSLLPNSPPHPSSSSSSSSAKQQHKWEERIGGYPTLDELLDDEHATSDELSVADMRDLDTEGRTTVCDFGLFVLINLYCPNETNDERLVFKNNFNRMVDRRVRNLIKLGREVIVVGDLNICASNLDSIESEARRKEQGLENFTDHPPRKWLSEFVGPGGPMVDVTRRFHPGREKMYTCWNTKIDARPANYGTRLDYILVTPALLPWISNSDIQPTIMGSDHCPVFIDFYDEIDDPAYPNQGRTLKLWDLLNPGRTRTRTGGGEQQPDPPAFATRYLDEFSGKQKKLSSFFTKGISASAPTTTPAPAITPPIQVKQVSSSAPTPVASTSFSSNNHNKDSTSNPTNSVTVKPKLKSAVLAVASSSGSTSTSNSTKSKDKDKDSGKTGQQSISSFFRPPPPPPPPKKTSSGVKKKKKTDTGKGKGKDQDQDQDQDLEVIVINPTASTSISSNSARTTPSVTLSPPHSPEDGDDPPLNPADNDNHNNNDDDEDGDFDVSDYLHQSQQQAAAAWSSLFAPKAVPKCDGHGEPSTVWTVNKSGINKGRRFYLCSRPVGPGYDQGQAKHKVNPEYRCNFFAWETSVKRPASVTASLSSSSSSSKKQKQ